jgi:hypothetical protein
MLGHGDPKKESLPNDHLGKTLSARAMPTTTAPTLDRWDIAILAELQRDARLSNAELAARIGLSAAPTWRRVRGWSAGLHHRLPRRDRPPQDRPGRAGLRARGRRAQQRLGHRARWKTRSARCPRW